MQTVGPVLIAVVSLAATAWLVIWLVRRLNRAAWEGSPERELLGWCENCQRDPACLVVVRRHVGLLVLQTFHKVEAELCRECGTRLIKNWTIRTLIQGWWGVFSFWLANPFTIVMNLVALRKVLKLEPPDVRPSDSGLDSPSTDAAQM